MVGRFRVITQAFFDFVRDILVNWISGITTLFDPSAAESAGAAIGSAGAATGAALWLILDPTLFGVAVGIFGTYLVVWLVTSLVAIFGRRAAG